MVAAICNSFKSGNSNNAIMSMNTTETSEEKESTANKNISIETQSESLKFLNGALKHNHEQPNLQCTIKQLEDVKIVIKILPIFMSTIMLNCCLAQLSTFFVQQAATMNTKLGSLKIPPASLPVFPVLFIMVLAPDPYTTMS